MTDIVERLRKWSNVVPVPPASQTMQEAAYEIERLRLTDEEREAIEDAISGMSTPDVHHLTPQAPTPASILRSLLERMHT